MRFSGTAKLLTGSAEVEESAKGISNPLAEYILSGNLDKNSFKLNFRTGDNKTGTLLLPLPVKMLNYKVDTRSPGESTDREPGATVSLYKEWRFEGAASGTGFFKPGFTAAPARYFLVLQGRGNRCDNASDFTHWRLEIGGKKAGYAFYGKLGDTVPVSQNR